MLCLNSWMDSRTIERSGGCVLTRGVRYGPKGSEKGMNAKGFRRIASIVKTRSLTNRVEPLKVVARGRRSQGPDPRANGHSERRAWMTSMRAARAAGSQDATTAAVKSTNAE